MFNRITAAAAAGSLLAVPVALVATAPSAHADVERNGTCGTGRYDFSVDREGGGWEVSADLDNVRPDSRWRVVLRHDGNKIASVVRRADHEGDLDVDRYRADSPGADVFTMKIKRVGGTASCGSTITVR